MRKRNCQILLWLSDEELEKLDANIKKCGLNRQSYLRKLIQGVQPKELPDLQWHTLLKNLRYLGNNMNQIAMIANSTRQINASQYAEDAKEVKDFLCNLKTSIDIENNFDYRKVVNDGCCED